MPKSLVVLSDQKHAMDAFAEAAGDGVEGGRVGRAEEAGHERGATPLVVGEGGGDAAEGGGECVARVEPGGGPRGGRGRTAAARPREEGGAQRRGW